MSVATMLKLYSQLSVNKTRWGPVPASGREVSRLEGARLKEGN